MPPNPSTSSPFHKNKQSFDKKDIQRLRTMIDDRLDGFFRQNTTDSRLGYAVRHGLLSPGKRIRPLITMLTYRQLGQSKPQILDAACAVEMVHAASLIMDDLPSMDNARLRRGALTTHVVFGEGAAMLAAITLVNEAFKIIGEIEGVAPEAKLKAISHLSRSIGIEGLAGGQDQDIACGEARPVTPNNHKATMKDLEKRHLEKTGALFASAAAIGAEFASADTHITQKLIQYGHSLGLAYQAFDDLLDVTCTEDETGKDEYQDDDKSTVVSLVGADAAHNLAQRHLTRAMELANEVSVLDTSPLADLAFMIGEKFGAMTGNDIR